MAQYFEVLVGFAAQPPPGYQVVPKGRRQQEQITAKNLLGDLLRRAEQIQAFLDDLSIPFTDNQTERDLCMVNQKIAGTPRGEDRTSTFCPICIYLSTMSKQS